MENENKKIEEYSLGDLNSIKKILQTLPQKIKQREEQIFAVETDKEDLILKNKIIESEVINKVSDEKIDGKPSFSNALKREIESNQRLSNNSGYKDNQEKIDNAINKVSIAKIELSYLKRLNNNAGYLALLGDEK